MLKAWVDEAKLLEDDNEERFPIGRLSVKLASRDGLLLVLTKFDQTGHMKGSVFIGLSNSSIIFLSESDTFQLGRILSQILMTGKMI